MNLEILLKEKCEEILGITITGYAFFPGGDAKK